MVPCWFEVPNPHQFTRQRFPCFIHTSPAGEFYGFPQIDGQGLKLAPHHCAKEVSSPAKSIAQLMNTMKWNYGVLRASADRAFGPLPQTLRLHVYAHAGSAFRD